MQDFRAVYKVVSDRIEREYCTSVSVGDVKDPNTGEFDGQEIWIDYNLDDEVALYVLVHLFGHTVQWNIDAELRKLGLDVSRTKTPEQLERIFRYEKQATRYGVTLLRECGIADMDQWISNWFGTDWRWLEHLYRTGEVLGHRDTWTGCDECLEPLEIPDFTPTKYEMRQAF
jgi:hypothetical protein